MFSMAGRSRTLQPRLQARGFYSGSRASLTRSQGTEGIGSTPPGRPHDMEPSYQPNESLFDLPSVRTYDEENSWALPATPLQGSSVYNMRMSDTGAHSGNNFESSVMTLLQEQQGQLRKLLSQQQGMQKRQDELDCKLSLMEQELAKIPRETPNLDNSKRKFRVTRDLTVSIS